MCASPSRGSRPARSSRTPTRSAGSFSTSRPGSWQRSADGSPPSAPAPPAPGPSGPGSRSTTSWKLAGMGELRVVELSPGLLAAEPGHHQARDGTNEPHHRIMNVIGDHLRLSGYIMTCSVWVAGLLNLIPRTPRTAAMRAGPVNRLGCSGVRDLVTVRARARQSGSRIPRAPRLAPSR